MVTIDTTSLANTLDAVNEALFQATVLTKSERKEIAAWITSLSGKPGSYADMFAPTGVDRNNGITVYTGERIISQAAIAHILGEESCRALILLNVTTPAVKEALNRATAGMLGRLRQSENAGKVQGLYCCGKCSAAYWRHVLAGGLDRNEERLLAGVQELKSLRIGNGRWRRFPFYYTLLALSEMDTKPAVDEMRYAAPLLERSVKRTMPENKFQQRRRILAEKVLSKC